MTTFYQKTFIILTALFFTVGVFGVANAQTIDVAFQGEPAPLFGETNILPGHSVSRTISVTNTGDQDYMAYVRTINTSSTNDLAEALLVTINEQGGGEVYSGSLQDLFDRNLGSLEDLSLVPEGQTRVYDFEVYFEEGSGNSYAEGTAAFDLCVGFDGGDETCISGTGNPDDNNGGGGGGSGGTTIGTTNPNNNPVPQVAGASTEGPFWNELIENINNRGEDILRAARGMVLGDDVDIELSTSSTSTQPDIAEIGGTAVEELVRDWCIYFWLLVLVWLVATAVAYWRERTNEQYADVMMGTQMVSGIIGIVLLAISFFFGLACLFWPALVVTCGSAVSFFLLARE